MPLCPYLHSSTGAFVLQLFVFLSSDVSGGTGKPGPSKALASAALSPVKWFSGKATMLRKRTPTAAKVPARNAWVHGGNGAAIIGECGKWRVREMKMGTRGQGVFKEKGGGEERIGV